MKSIILIQSQFETSRIQRKVLNLLKVKCGLRKLVRLCERHTSPIPTTSRRSFHHVHAVSGARIQSRGTWRPPTSLEANLSSLAGQEMLLDLTIIYLTTQSDPE